MATWNASLPAYAAGSQPLRRYSIGPLAFVAGGAAELVGDADKATLEAGHAGAYLTFTQVDANGYLRPVLGVTASDMAKLHHSRLDGRYVGVVDIDSAGAWTDVTLADLVSLTDESIPESGVAIVAVEVRETSGANASYLLLRASDGEAADPGVALETPAGAGRGLSCNLSNPVDTLSVYGTAQITCFLV